MEYQGISYLKRKMSVKKTRVNLRYKYYEGKKLARDFGISTPPRLQAYGHVLGWCAKGVDVLADRLIFRDFKNDNFNINEIYNLNNPDTFFDSAVLSALIASCCFVYISDSGEDIPHMQVIDGGSATGIIDPITGLLREGYAVLERDKNDNPSLEAYFAPGRTDYYQSGKLVDSREYALEYPLLVPIIYRPDARREFGHSRISRSCMDIVQSAMRTVKRSEISAEFYSFPQKYVVGTSPDFEPMDKWRAAMSTMMEFTKDEDGDKPQVGQFTQQSMAPHFEQLRTFAALFAGETGLTMDDLGFVSDNPSSSEAIKASHENLRLTARKAQRTFGSGFLNAGYLAACLRDNFPYERAQFYKTRPRWEPIFEPDAASLSSYGDGAIKINRAIPGYITPEIMRDMTGMGGDTDGGYSATAFGEDTAGLQGQLIGQSEN